MSVGGLRKKGERRSKKARERCLLVLLSLGFASCSRAESTDGFLLVASPFLGFHSSKRVTEEEEEHSPVRVVEKESGERGWGHRGDGREKEKARSERATEEAPRCLVGKTERDSSKAFFFSLSLSFSFETSLWADQTYAAPSSWFLSSEGKETAQERGRGEAKKSEDEHRQIKMLPLSHPGSAWRRRRASPRP